MLIKMQHIDRGDTLIEVLFATAIFSLIAVGGLAIMNQGSAASQRALEITLVRNEIDAQAETLRFLNASYIAAYQPGVSSYAANTPAGQWQLMHDSIYSTNNSAASNFGATTSSCPSIPEGSFILNSQNASFVSPSSDKVRAVQDATLSGVTSAKVSYNDDGSIKEADGIWIEAVHSAQVLNNGQDNAGYIDFNIRACWDSPGQDVPATIGTIVRLYEPRG